MENCGKVSSCVSVVSDLSDVRFYQNGLSVSVVLLGVSVALASFGCDKCRDS
jgi:hypothetical protein